MSQKTDFKKERVNEYIITKNGEDCTTLHFRSVIGYSLARETVRELSERYDKDKWDIRKILKEDNEKN